MARWSTSAYGGPRVCIMVMFVMMVVVLTSMITVQSTSLVLSEAEHLKYDSETWRLGVRRALRTRSDELECGDDDGEEEDTGGCGGSRMCCKGQCVDSCGACDNQCAYNKECCGGVCVDTHASDPFHCGACGNVCADGLPCLFGLCGYNSRQLTSPNP